MKHKIYKQALACVLFVFISVYSRNIFAQFITVPTKMSTPRGTITIPTQRYTPMYYNYQNGNRKHDFTIVLLNDSVVQAKTKINIGDSIHTLEWGKKENKTIIRPSETKEIYRMDDGKKITGIPADSCWLFLVDDGKIKTYSITSETDYPLIQYMQKNETGPIMLLTKENMLEMVKDNEKASKLAEKGKLLKAISVYNDQ
jgi:hypothetical protein